MFQKLFKDIHWPLVFAKVGLAMIGTAFIYSAAYHDSGTYQNKQLFWLTVGFFIFFLVPWIGYRKVLSVSYLVYVIAIVLLLWVLVAGQTRLGAQRWLSIGPFAFQPSEFAKLATLLAVANFLGANRRWEKEKRIMAVAIFLCAVPFFLIARQPDLGSALMFLPLMAACLLVWGIRYRYLIASFVSGLVGLPLVWSLLKEYQKKRILVFLDPERDPLGSGYTAIQSKIAVGSGGLFGKGFLAGTQSQLQFVPEHHTDFIFCVIGEEWGFLGAVVVLLMYGLLFHAAFQVINHTTDQKAKLLCVGVIAILFTQTFINIGMSIGIMPITGITLPLVSYGGSSFVVTSFALGLLLSIYKERSIF